jgi:hypothetical protein
MAWREEIYDNVHEQILEDLEEEYVKWDEARKWQIAIGGQGIGICRQKIEQVLKRAHKIRS